MNEIDIFSLNDLSDIPLEIKNDLKRLSRDNKRFSGHGFEKRIIELFLIANIELNIDQVTVAYFRLFNEKKNRKQILAKLYNISKYNNPAIESVSGKQGVYKIIPGWRGKNG